MENHKELLASEENRICPYCGGYKEKLELLCYYSNDGIMWSDYRHLLPQVPAPSLIQRCPHCGKCFMIKVSHVLINDTADYEFIDPVCWDYFSQSYVTFPIYSTPISVTFPIYFYTTFDTFPTKSAAKLLLFSELCKIFFLLFVEIWREAGRMETQKDKTLLDEFAI